MYSPPHHNVNLDIEDEVNNSNSTEEERENSEDADDSWDQVMFLQKCIMYNSPLLGSTHLTGTSKVFQHTQLLGTDMSYHLLLYGYLLQPFKG